MRLVHNFVECVVTEPICAAQALASLDLDNLCLRIGRHNLAKLVISQEDILSDFQDAPTVVYLVSCLKRSGGHSRLVRDFIQSQPEKNHIILSTEIGGFSDAKFLSKLFAAEGGVRFERAPSGNLERRLTWLQSVLKSIRPEHVYLFNHHQDSVAVAAMVPELGIEGSFCHHGDHHLCLGVHLDHLNHIDFHPMGFHYCRDEFGIDNQYLPLTFEGEKYISSETNFMRDGKLITATAARSNKVEIPYYASYLDIIPRILKSTGGRHIHIGRLTPWGLFRIYHQMRKQGIQKDRFIYIKWKPSVWKSLQDNKVDLYLASFPYGAGLTLIEAQGAGIPVVLHEHMYSRVLSGFELAYPEAFKWSDTERLLKHLIEVTPYQLCMESRLARRHYESFHHSGILRMYFKDQEKWNPNIPSLAKEFKPRWDEWSAWVLSQQNFHQLAIRLMYRTFRKIRYLFS